VTTTPAAAPGAPLSPIPESPNLAPPKLPTPPTPPTPAAPKPAPEDSAAPAAKLQSRMLRGESLLLTLVVPAEAKVLINGHATTTTGTERLYVSNGLKAQKTYPYRVEVVIPRDGEEPVHIVKTLNVKGGDDLRLAITGRGSEERLANLAR
jgi:uncharacterized protein (TIGR03000 family)